MLSGWVGFNKKQTGNGRLGRLATLAKGGGAGSLQNYVNMAALLAEINTEKEEEPPSKSTRISLSKLPKLGVFSTSKCTSAVEVDRGHSESDRQKEKPLSKPPSRRRQAKEESSRTVSTQRLDIRIDLPSVKSAAAAAPTDDDEKPQSRGESTTKTLPSCLHIWERNKNKEERSRTKTWPALHYKLWLDASNLPFHLLTNDERANRPPEYYSQPHRRKLSANHVHSGSSNSFKGAPTVRNSRDWTARFLSVSKPPVRSTKVSAITSGTSVGKGSAESGSERDAVAGLRVGVGESWQVTSSYTQKIPRVQDRLIPTGANSNTPLAVQNEKKPRYPRLPSRMGPNSLGVYLKQNNISRAHHLSEFNESRPTTTSSELMTLVSPRYFCNAGAELSLLTLRSFARNPKMLQEASEMKLSEAVGTMSDEATKDTIETSLGEVGGVKQVRFKVPCGRSNEDDYVKTRAGVVRMNKGGCLRPQVWSDVTPPPTPPTFEQVYRIRHFCTSNSVAKT